MIGTSRTMDMISLGRHITAREALDWGLCNKMVNCGTGNVHNVTFLFVQQILPTKMVGT